ncbi:alpha-mannosidase 2 [Anabrus simplex]|uniref:alpha-mannosidase 2 n=1 Tax=Anabrus simplex TaxID=316456 RepID=UPI0035A38D0A
MVDKLQKFHDMTFMWTEVAFFAQWWESAHPTKRRVVRELLAEGRLEITTGGWVMTDEANTHIYAMVDQLIEGHQWVKNNLGLAPKSGWSIDPFGHGATVPYLLKASGFSGGTIIQRIHYAWKQWLAEQQMGDFMWRQNWDSDGRTDILVHNQPFDIYSIKHSCGPHPQVCLNFDFRKIPGEYTEYSLRAVPIDKHNIKEKAELLLEQYGRTGSLFPHNVVLMPLGDDFRYDHDIEWDQQYKNYKLLFDYINKNKDKYNAEVQFGTPSDYFEAVKERSKTFQSLRGDFFVYSDIFSEGRPAYWSGYFTTRPYWKILDRELEASLRSAEILYTIALNRARQNSFNKTIQLLERDYERLTKARKNLALFQHHDAITGTSKAFVMHDYALKLFEGIQDTVYVQGRCAQALLVKDFKENVNSKITSKKPIEPFVNFLLPDTDRESYEKLAQKVPLVVPRNEPRRIVLFNSLVQQRQEVVKVRTTSPNVRVLDSDGNVIPFQVNPVWNLTSSVNSAKEAGINEGSENGDTNKGDSVLQMTRDLFEVIFVADLPPLSLMTFVIERVAEKNLESRSIVYCASCGKNSEDSSYVSPFEVKSMQAGDIQLENHRMKLLFDGRSGFLKAVTRKSTGRTTQCGLQFAAYPSAQYHSGAYLFMPDPNSREPEREILFDEPYGRRNLQIVITSGPIASELTVIYNTVLTHSVRIYHAAGPLSEGIYIENIIDFGAPPKNRETELFMRVVSDISNGDPPEFYSDQNGFQMQRRVKVERIGIEGNYFPITSMAYIQDTTRRLSLLVNHAQGAASWQPGWLEVMLDRRTLYDDSRGMGEGIVDNKRVLTKFWLLLEEITEGNEKDTYSRPSLFAHHLSNSLLYPANLFVVEGISEGQQNSGKEQHGNQERELTLHKKVQLLTKPFPCDVHLLNMRTSSDPNYMQFPSTSSLLVLHRQGYACNVGAGIVIPQCGLEPGTEGKPSPAFHKRTLFRNLKLHTISQTTLTGLHQKAKYVSLDDVRMEPMELLSLNITFVL